MSLKRGSLHLHKYGALRCAPHDFLCYCKITAAEYPEPIREAMTVPEISVPVIDISGYLAGDPAAKEKCAAQFREACSNQGFLQVIGHSVSPDIQSRFLDAIAKFFKLPLEEKMKIAQDKSPCSRGYERVGGQKLDELDESATVDQKEGFSIRPERELGVFLAGPNQWPDPALPGMEEFKETYMEYFDAVHGLSKKVFRLLALSLGLEEEYFDEFAADPDGS
jgi:isopenicillin N synthase-like dioxygenase